jgi:hypothetical protein
MYLADLGTIISKVRVFIMRLKKLLGVGISVAIVFSVMPLQVLADEISDQIRCRSIESADYSVQENITASWDGHANIEIIFTNNGSETIDDWYYTFDFAYEIENPYNCYIVEHEGNLYTVGNNDWNQDIKPGESVTIGFTAASTDGSQVEIMPSFYLLNTKTAEFPAEAVSLEYTEYSDWTDGFSGAVLLKNNSGSDLRDWSVTFSANRPITEAFGSVLTINDDGTYTISNDGNMQNVVAYSSYQFGFNGGAHDSSVPFEISDLSVKTRVLGISLSADNNGNGTPDVCETDYSGEVSVITPTPTEMPTVEPTATVTPEPTTTSIPTTTPTEVPTITETPTTTPEPTITEIPTNTPTSSPTAVPTGSAYSLIDSDSDLLPDDYEELYGTDKNDSDSDDDGVLDGYEILLGMDPLNPDSDGDGIIDGEEDYDQDGLTDAEESIYGTNPMLGDSDLDGLTDYEEIYTYSTSPNKYDTDGDSISDYKEIQIGSDPLVSDSEVKRTQTLTVDLNDEEHPSGVESVSVKCYMDGCILDNTTIKDIYGIDEQSSSIKALIGVPVEIETTGKFTSATITFKYSDDIDESNLKIMWYDEANYQYVVLDNSIVNTAENTVSVQTTHFSKYMLIDMSVWINTFVGACMYSENYFYIPSGEMDPSEYLGWILSREPDSDGDGLPNCMETGGMLNNCGQLIYTDPYNSDTDGDGITDRIEMGELKDLIDVVPYSYIQEYASILPYSAKQHPYYFYCFKQKSSPIKEESIMTVSDGCYETTNLGGGSYSVDELDYEGYIHVNNLPEDIEQDFGAYITGAYGGNQSWFSVVPYEPNVINENDILGSLPWADIAYEGCGLIAATDVSTYLCEKDNKPLSLSYDDYIKLVAINYETLSKRLISTGTIGLPIIPVEEGVVLDTLTFTNSNCTTKTITLPLNTFIPKDVMIEKIIDSLENDCPVVISVFNCISGDGDINIGEKVYLFDYINGGFEVNKNTLQTNYHYMTITGVVKDLDTGKYYLRVQSWGKEYYLDFDNIYESNTVTGSVIIDGGVSSISYATGTTVFYFTGEF